MRPFARVSHEPKIQLVYLNQLNPQERRRRFMKINCHVDDSIDEEHANIWIRQKTSAITSFNN